MKQFVYITLISLLVACSGGDKGGIDAKKKKLAELKKEVATLELEIAKSDTSQKNNIKLKNVAVTEIRNGSFQHYIDIQGKVDADENVNVTSKMPGTVTAIYVKTGQTVTAGQVLAQLDDRAVRQGLAELENRFELAKTVFEKQKALWDQKIGSEIAFLQAKNNKDALEKSKATLIEQIDMYKIKSLIGGVVDDVQMKLGQMVSPGFNYIRVVNNSKLKIKADVAETYASKVKTGNPVIIQFPDLGVEISSSISYSGKVINQLTRTFNVEASITGDLNEYRPNMVAVMKIIDYNNPTCVVIPINTIQNDESGTFVYIYENGKSVKRIVSTGYNYGGKIEIKNGLNPGDKLITTGYEELNDGDQVKL